jgi:hypothetical protein
VIERYALALVTLALLACRPPLVAATPKVSLRMAGSPAEATVIIDDEVVGSLDLVAAHDVTVKASGYFPWDREVKAVEGQAPIRLEVALAPVPD